MRSNARRWSGVVLAILVMRAAREHDRIAGEGAQFAEQGGETVQRLAVVACAVTPWPGRLQSV
jgi:hypothetical protein